MKKTYLIVSIAIVLLTIVKVKSQNLTNYNLYISNPVLYNPAYTIDDAKWRAFLNTHLQWIGFTGAPRAYTCGLYFNPLKNMGFGLSAYNYSQGITSSTLINVSYAYKAKFSKTHYLTLGLAVGTLTDNLSTGKIQNSDMSDQTIQSYKQTSFGVRAGLGYHYKALEFQFAMPQLYQQSKISAYNISALSYDFKLDNSWNVKPVIMYRSVSTSPQQYGLNAVVTYQKKIWVQAGYESNNSLLFGFGFNYKDIQFGYAYQAERSYISAAAIGTNEIQLVFRFGKKWDETTSGSETAMNENVMPAKSGNICDTLYIVPDNTNIVGTIIRKADSRLTPGTITVYDNDKVVQKVNVKEGTFSLDLKSGKTYKFEISADNYPTVTQTIEIPKKTLLKQLIFPVEAAVSAVKTSVMDNETKSPLKASCIISSNGKVVKTVTVDGITTIELESGAVYTLDCNSDGYYNKKITVDLTSKDKASPTIQMEKVKKESFGLGMVNFETNKSILKQESFPVLDNFITVLQNNPKLKFEIQGHTDNVGNPAANKILSQNRAQACVDYMISKGIASNRLISKGYGDTKPLVPNNTPENRAKNRRVEAKVIE